MRRLVRTLDRYANVIRLLLGQLSKLGPKLSKVKSRNLLIQMLWQNVNLLLVFPRSPFVPKFKLCNDLVSERTRHNKARMTCSTTQVHQTTLSQYNDARFCVREYPSTVHVDFIVKVTNVRDNSINLETFHESLKGTDGIDFSYYHTGTSLFQCSSTALSYISISANNTDLSGNHYICGPHKTVGQVIDIDSREKQRSIVLHLIQSLDTSGSLLRNTNQSLLHLSVFLRVILQPIFNQTKHNLKFRVIRRSRVGQSTRFLILLLSLNTLMNQKSGITTIIHDQIGSTSRTPVEGTFSAPPVLLQCLSLPGEHSGAVAGDGGGGVVLGGENTGHFDFGQVQLETAEIGLGHVLYLVLPAGGLVDLRFGKTVEEEGGGGPPCPYLGPPMSQEVALFITIIFLNLKILFLKKKKGKFENSPMAIPNNSTL
ncbi:hypothetical protein ACJIZ3_009750 [Penstemon smallii]|uniref:Uncharacterized protein n=1 Tax=Penstemon smallii TaxID=265156 RepID=A0ABD3TDD2_9LAMI